MGKEMRQSKQKEVLLRRLVENARQLTGTLNTLEKEFPECAIYLEVFPTEGEFPWVYDVCVQDGDEMVVKQSNWNSCKR